ncbi:MAG: sigma-70 family RNA polymerase sigma factor [Candidatus Anammoximicrobium sp.]|nr:sigma-70 family RNA polymerase sigma factor [Candidatus Anammoximicrobium sp.]
MELTPTDESLMHATAEGDLAAFEQLVLRHQQSVWQTAYRVLGCRQTAEDVAQEVFLSIFQAADRYQPTAAFRTYLRRVVVRRCLDCLRKRRPAPTDDVWQIVDPTTSPEQDAAGRERARAVAQALNRLPANQRLAIVLRYYEGLRGQEIAAAMDTSVKAVERLLARGRAALERQLADFLLD